VGDDIMERRVSRFGFDSLKSWKISNHQKPSNRRRSVGMFLYTPLPIFIATNIYVCVVVNVAWDYVYIFGVRFRKLLVSMIGQLPLRLSCEASNEIGASRFFCFCPFNFVTFLMSFIAP
jgi:hypothetical protein